MKKTTLSPTIIRLAEPSRNFNFLTAIALDDPQDGREKLVLSNLVGGGRGNLIIIDVLTRKEEVIPLPIDEGAWAVLPIDGKSLMVGTCTAGGYIASLDLQTREWTKPIRDSKATYIWKFTRGSDGMVYGGAYPTGSLVRCDPACTAVEDLGCPSSHPDNRYCRDVYGDIPGFIIVTGGFATVFLGAFNIGTGVWTLLAEADGKDHFNIQEITANHIVVEHAGEILRFDTRTFQPVETPSGEDREKDAKTPFRMAIAAKLTAFLKDGRAVGARGQEYFIEQPGTGKREFYRLSLEPSPTAIRSLAVDGEGTVWGSCCFGQTIFRYNLADGTFWNTLAVTERMGEVYGMVFAGGLLYMSCYAGGDHVVYDPAQPWDERGNINPRTLQSVYPTLQRPRAGSVMGPDGGVWTGWSAKYGVYGGGLTRMDRVTREVTSWMDPIPAQQVMGVSADSQYLYFTTNSGGEGLPVRDEPGWFCVWDPAAGLVSKHPLAPGDAVGKLCAVGGIVLIVEKEGLQRFDPKTGTFLGKIEMNSGAFNILDLGGTKVAAICGPAIRIIDYVSGVVDSVIELPGTSSDAVVLPGGDIVFASETGLFQLSRS